jgi:hypothetical protein
MSRIRCRGEIRRLCDRRRPRSPAQQPLPNFRLSSYTVQAVNWSNGPDQMSNGQRTDSDDRGPTPIGRTICLGQKGSKRVKNGQKWSKGQKRVRTVQKGSKTASQSRRSVELVVKPDKMSQQTGESLQSNHIWDVTAQLTGSSDTSTNSPLGVSKGFRLSAERRNPIYSCTGSRENSSNIILCIPQISRETEAVRLLRINQPRSLPTQTPSPRRSVPQAAQRLGPLGGRDNHKERFFVCLSLSPEQQSGLYAGSRIWRFLVRDQLGSDTTSTPKTFC